MFEGEGLRATGLGAQYRNGELGKTLGVKPLSATRRHRRIVVREDDIDVALGGLASVVKLQHLDAAIAIFADSAT